MKTILIVLAFGAAATFIALDKMKKTKPRPVQTAKSSGPLKCYAFRTESPSLLSEGEDVVDVSSDVQGHDIEQTGKYRDGKVIHYKGGGCNQFAYEFAFSPFTAGESGLAQDLARLISSYPLTPHGKSILQAFLRVSGTERRSSQTYTCGMAVCRLWVEGESLKVQYRQLRPASFDKLKPVEVRLE